MLDVMVESQGWKDQHAPELFAYERLMARAIGTNTMQWQTPSLALAAQAFLLTIALRPEIAPLSATFACLVGLLITGMALQLMARHRWYFHLDRLDMRDLEETVGLLRISVRESQQVRHPGEKPFWLGRWGSFRFWQVGLLLIAYIDAGIAFDAWFPGKWVIVSMGVVLGVGLLTCWSVVLLASPLTALRRLGYL